MKNKKNQILNRGITQTQTEMSTIVKILIGIIIFLVVVYYVGGIVTGNINLKKDEDVSIQYSEILAEQTFKQNDDKYYVLYYDFTSNQKSVIEAISSDLSNDQKLYKVDLNKKFNTLYLKEEASNKNPSNASDIKLKGITLIKIENKKVVEYIEGIDNIKEYALDL